ncbi:hypothetical protein Tco_0568131 [Tanacetum coccineum]
MENENPIRTLEEYSKPSHEGYQNTIELPDGNNVVPLRSDTIWLVQNGCSFYGLWSEDPNQHLKDFLNLVDSLDFNVDNKERMCLSSIQVNKIASSCEICSGPHDINYCMENPEQAFIDYASSRTDKARGLVSNFMASQDARLTKFEADLKQQQSEMTNKIDTVLKAINDRITGALPSDIVKNPKLNVNSTSPVLSARSYLMEDPQCLSHPLNSINAIKTCSKEMNHSQKDQMQAVIKTNTQQKEKPEQTLENEFKDLHLNLSVLEVLAHALMYNAILDKYVKSLELGKNGSAFIQGEMPERMKDLGLFTLPCRLGDSKPFNTLADLGSYVNLIPLYLFKKPKIRLLKETDHVFGFANGTNLIPYELSRM